MGMLVKRFGDTRLASAGALLLCAGLVVLPASPSIALLLGVTAVIGLGHALVVTPLNGLASRLSSASQQGKALGTMQGTSSLGRIAGPLIGGWLLDMDLAHGPVHFGRSPYWTGAVIMLVACGLILCIRVSGEAGG